MTKKALALICILAVCFSIISCSVYRKPLDKHTTFSEYLKKTEAAVNKGQWQDARKNLESTRTSWKKVKPLLQIDIDHDYINDIEEAFSLLEGYIQAKEKGDSLASIKKIREIWNDIGQM